MEIWKDIYFEENGKIYDYRGIYQVSTLGRVKSLERLGSDGRKVKERILKVGRDEKGYELVSLCKKNNKRKSFKVHRLVAQAFLPNQNNLPCIDHINTIRNDNRVENLRWCSHKENCNNPLTLERYKGENNPRARKVVLLNTEEVFDYVGQAEEKYGVAYQSISKCCNGKRKSAGKHPITGEPLVWLYYSDYLNLTQEEIDEIKIFISDRTRKRA